MEQSEQQRYRYGGLVVEELADDHTAQGEGAHRVAGFFLLCVSHQKVGLGHPSPWTLHLHWLITAI